MQNGCETLRVSAIRRSGYVWPGKLKRPPLPSGVKSRMQNIRVEWQRVPLSGLPQGEAHGTRNHHTPDDSILYPDMLSGWKRPTFGRPPMVCPDALSGHLLLWIPKNSPQSRIALVITKLSKHQNLTQFD